MSKFQVLCSETVCYRVVVEAEFINKRSNNEKTINRRTTRPLGRID